MSSRPRIAIIAASAPPYSAGGVASAHYNLFRAMRREGLDVKLFTFFDNDAPWGEKDAIVRHGIHPRWASYLNMLAQLPFRLLLPRRQAHQAATILRSHPGARRMAKSIADFNADVVILSDHGAPGLALRKHAHQRFFLISHHNPVRFAEEPLIGDYAMVDARLAVRLEQRVLRKVDQVICPSHYMADYFRRVYDFGGPITVVPNLIDSGFLAQIDATEIPVDPALPPGTPFIYMPAAGSLVKGAGFLSTILAGLNAIGRSPLGVYIPGPMEADLEQQIHTRYTNLRFYAPGQVEYAQHISLVKACRFGISPAVMENFSMAIMEAAFCGVPMIVFDRGGNRDIISDAENGFLVPAFDVAGICSRAEQLLLNPDMEAFQQSTRNYTRQHFNTKHVLQQYLHILGLD